MKDNQVVEKWYVFYLRSRYEKKALTELDFMGFVSYLPMQKVLKVYTDRKKWVEEPVFKSYIFVKAKIHQLTEIVSQVPGILAWVKYAGAPATIREKELEFIHILLSNNSSFEVAEEVIRVGDEITLTSGPFVGFKGQIMEQRGKRKFIVVLENMNHSIIVEL